MTGPAGPVRAEAAEPVVVLVSGMPGAGKTTLAAPLAAALGMPLLGKDTIKEALFDALPGPPADASPDARLAWSRRLGAATIALMWRLAQDAPRVVLESNFQPDHPGAREALAALRRPVVEVHCTCPPEVAAARYAARAARPGRHAGAHPLTVLPAGTAALHRPFDAGPVLTVDTTQPVDVSAVTSWVRSRA